jgi:hypothetical protein
MENERDRRESDIRHLVKIEVQQEHISAQFDKHEKLDDERFSKITAKLDDLIKNQTRLMAFGLAAFTVISFAANHFFG